MTLRYALELSLLIPAVIFAVLPVADSVRVRHYALVPCAFVMAGVIMAGAFLASFGASHRIRVRYIAVPIATALFILYMLAVDDGAGKKLFCFFNAVTLCMACPMYTMYINAPREMMNFSGVFTLSSGIISVTVSVILGAIFFRTLTVKFPFLMKEDSIRDIWRYMFVIPLMMSALIFWMTPNFPAVVMTGRVRPVGLALVVSLTGGIFMLCHVFWLIVSRMSERARLQQENDILSMEAKRYTELRAYMDETRALRHDFRQHISVMSELSRAGRIPELEAYISQMAEKAGRGYKSFCVNRAVDAIASHYDRIAGTAGAKISWRLDLPSTLPVKEPEYCAMLGNLVENALNAVKTLPPEKRNITAISSMLSRNMIGLSVSNEYSGAITFGADGLPVSGRKGHGTGLISVMNTVNHYAGSMSIGTEGNIFTADIILYS